LPQKAHVPGKGNKNRREFGPVYPQVVHNKDQGHLARLTPDTNGNIMQNKNRRVVEVCENADIYTDMQYNTRNSLDLATLTTDGSMRKEHIWIAVS